MKKYLILALCLISLTMQAKKKSHKPLVKYAVIVGLDGLSSECLRTTDAMPFLRSLMKRGSWALHKRSVLPSASACNWASLYMGAGPEQHGYNTWGSRKPDFPSDTLTDHGFFPDIYYLAKKTYSDRKIIHSYEWTGMHYVVDTLSVDRDIKFDVNKGELPPILSAFKQDLPIITSIIIDRPDHEGHKYGWVSPEYIAACNNLDKHLEQIWNTVVELGIQDDTAFIVVSDHGGTGKGHGGISMQELEAPVVFVGRPFKADFEIPQTVSITDVIPTLATLMGIPYPDAWKGKPLRSALR